MLFMMALKKRSLLSSGEGVRISYMFSLCFVKQDFVLNDLFWGTLEC